MKSDDIVAFQECDKIPACLIFTISACQMEVALSLRPCCEGPFSCFSDKVPQIQPELGGGRGKKLFEERNALSVDEPGSHSDPLKVADPSQV